MKNLKIVTSSVAPKQTDVIWARQVEGGFALYFREGRTWKPLKLIDKGEAGFADDLVIDLSSAEIESKKSAFILKATSTKEGVTSSQLDTFKSAIRSGIMNIDGIFASWNRGPITFEFHYKDTMGNLKVRVPYVSETPVDILGEMFIAINYVITIEEDELTNNPTIVVSDPVIVGTNESFYTSVAASIKTILESVDVTVMENVLDTRYKIYVTTSNNDITDAQIITMEENILNLFTGHNLATYSVFNSNDGRTEVEIGGYWAGAVDYNCRVANDLVNVFLQISYTDNTLTFGRFLQLPPEGSLPNMSSIEDKSDGKHIKLAKDLFRDLDESYHNDLIAFFE